MAHHGTFGTIYINPGISNYQDSKAVLFHDIIRELSFPDLTKKAYEVSHPLQEKRFIGFLFHLFTTPIFLSSFFFSSAGDMPFATK